MRWCCHQSLLSLACHLTCTRPARGVEVATQSMHDMYWHIGAVLLPRSCIKMRLRMRSGHGPPLPLAHWALAATRDATAAAWGPARGDTMWMPGPLCVHCRRHQHGAIPALHWQPPAPCRAAPGASSHGPRYLPPRAALRSLPLPPPPRRPTRLPTTAQRRPHDHTTHPPRAADTMRPSAAPLRIKPS